MLRYLVPLALLACTQSSAPGPKSSHPKTMKEAAPLHGVMQEHFVHLDALQKAVIAGDLVVAKQSARWVEEHHVEARNPEWGPHLQALEVAAKVVTGAPDLAQAALGAGQVAGACGSCHEAHGIDLALSAPPQEGPAGERGHMKRHQWAADRLWDAVVGNSDGAWMEATAALSDAPMSVSKDREGPGEVELVNAAAEAAHEIARKAKDLKAREARVRALGEFLSTCSACHTHLGVAAPQARGEPKPWR